MNVAHVLSRYRREIDGELKSVVPPYRSGLYDMMRYHFGWIDEAGEEISADSGKALRPTLCLLACGAVGGDYRKALPAAAAIELIHNFSLIHDDIQDNDEERRHRPTVWKIWGKPQAINAGSAMRVLADMSLQRLDHNEVPQDKQAMIREILDETTLRLIEGQFLDIGFESRNDITVDEYIAMISGKTAALISCSMEVGALIGSGNGNTMKDMGDCGKNLGLAFQVRDDMLGIWGDPRVTGKALGSDIGRKKKSLPVVLALSKARGRSRDILAGIYEKEELQDNDISEVLDIMEQMEINEAVAAILKEYSARAAAMLDVLDIHPGARKDFDELFSFLSVRNY